MEILKLFSLFKKFEVIFENSSFFIIKTYKIIKQLRIKIKKSGKNAKDRKPVKVNSETEEKKSMLSRLI